jgi:hypothetical protein
MNGTPGDLSLNIAPDVQSPDETFSIRTQNKDFTTYQLSEKEASLFQEQFNVLVNDFDSRLSAELFKQRSSIIGNVASHAKQQFDEKLFGGINAGDNEIAFDVLRPGHIRADPSTGNVVNEWDYIHSGDGTNTSAGDGWSDWIGDGSSANDYTVDEDQVILALGFMDTPAMVFQTDGSGNLNGFETVLDKPVTSGVNVERFGRNV